MPTSLPVLPIGWLMVPVTHSATREGRVKDTEVPMAESNGVGMYECARGRLRRDMPERSRAT
ncbi:hypothetical protein GCM10023086_56980 [Streptomyces venetus]|uniref:Secreted protein n=1 Tax=Streptomyces venetus TaxID=1701086 RepID=A0ABP8GQ67_9ACTN